MQVHRGMPGQSTSLAKTGSSSRPECVPWGADSGVPAELRWLVFHAKVRAWMASPWMASPGRLAPSLLRTIAGFAGHLRRHCGEPLPGPAPWSGSSSLIPIAQFRYFLTWRGDPFLYIRLSDNLSRPIPSLARVCCLPVQTAVWWTRSGQSRHLGPRGARVGSSLLYLIDN